MLRKKSNPGVGDARARKGIVGKTWPFLNSHPVKFPQVIRAELVGSNRAEAFGLVAIGYEPLLSLCRKLIRAGLNPDTPVECYRGSVLALRVRSLASAAQLTVKDGRPRFKRYSPPAVDRPAPPIAGNALTAPGTKNNASCEAPAAEVVS